MKKLLLIILTLFCYTSVQADGSRSRTEFESENKKFEFRLINAGKVFDKPFEDEIWIMFEKSSEKEIYRIIDHFWSKIVLVSDDGKSIVAVDDYSIRDYAKNLEVLTFYQNGIKTKGYKLSDLFDKKILAYGTVSHFRWSNFDEEKDKIDKSKFNLTTYELNNFTFDVNTGEILKKERDKALTNDSVFVMGSIKKLQKTLYEITVKCSIFGDISEGEKIQFEHIDIHEDDILYTVTPFIIKNRKLDITTETAMVNLCKSK